MSLGPPTGLASLTTTVAGPEPLVSPELPPPITTTATTMIITAMPSSASRVLRVMASPWEAVRCALVPVAVEPLGRLGLGDVLDDVDRQRAGVLEPRRLGQQPVLAAGLAMDAARQQLRRLLARQQPLARQVGLSHRRPVFARDDEARGQLARLGGIQLLDRLRAQQRRGRGIGIHELAALVVDGDGLGQRGEDVLEP